jgi:hypothetical protein
MRKRFVYSLLASALWVLVACQASPARVPGQPSLGTTQQATVALTQSPLAHPGACENRFVTHTLPFSTGTRMRVMNGAPSNGSGLAVNDLDGDGDLDLVFASVDRESAILWNQGNLSFRMEELPTQFARAAAIVDVDGDQHMDIVFTDRLGEVVYWRNLGSNDDGARFVQTPLNGVSTIPYAMAWADLNGDNELDLVTGSYNIELKQQGVDQPTVQDKLGVFVYEQHRDKFTRQRLSEAAEALAIALTDLDGDGQTDIWVGNDFVLQDGIWLRRGQEWEPAKPFAQTSHSTMSIDWGDIDNDGNNALFTTDMNPYDTSPRTLAQWLPMMAKTEEKHERGDPQIMANALQVRDSQGAWRNEAAQRGIDATGWSWAGKFGDLDNDGFLDLYVVNGMIAADLFPHLERNELVEENKAFRNQGDGMFTPAPEWNLASTSSGRGMMMADLDTDGDLDIVVNNLRGSAQLFENRLCGGSSLQVDLFWPESKNTRAIGAQVELYTSRGVFRRDVRAMSGYLSGDPARLHFGFPNDTVLDSLDIYWPDGATSRIDDLTPHALLEVTR